MISLYQAMRWDLLLAPFFLIFWIGLRMKARHTHLHINELPDTARRLFGYRMGSYLALLLFVVSLLAWVGLILAVRFDWSRNDVIEIEILQFSSPYPQINAERTINIKDKQTLSRLFDDLELLKPYTSEHEHAVGKSYILRLRRQSDGQWSHYCIAIYPDRETTGGLLMTGVYATTINYGSRWSNVGGYYQTPELGRHLAQLPQDENAAPQ